MSERKRTDRRTILKAGLAGATGMLLPAGKSHAFIKPKAAGETKVVYLGGDQLHNGLGQRQSIRQVLSPAGWRLMFATDARYVTPEFISDADLLIVTRWDGPVEGWSPEPIVEGPQEGDGYMSAELEAAIIQNVRERGMGYIALHCTIWTPDKPEFLKLLGIKPMMHGPVQTVRMHNFNKSHPISAGIEDFDLPLDENFGVELTDPRAISLYESTGHDDKRHDIAGWCIEQGKGRVVGLAAGHTYTAWRDTRYQTLYWRAAHWAMKRDIPPFPL